MLFLNLSTNLQANPLPSFLGWSEASPDPRTSDVMVQELHVLLRNTGIEGPYILVGHSFGVIVLRRFAQQYADELAGIVLVDSAHKEQGERLPFLKDATDELVGQFCTFSTVLIPESYFFGRSLECEYSFGPG